jgi:quinol monooxygenase YgiN
MSGRYVIEITFRLNPDKRLEFEQSSEDLICCEGPGHVKTKVLEPTGHARLVVWTSEWSDRDKLNAYLDGERFKVLMGGLRTLGTRISLQVGEFQAEDSPFEGNLTGEGRK